MRNEKLRNELQNEMDYQLSRVNHFYHLLGKGGQLKIYVEAKTIYSLMTEDTNTLGATKGRKEFCHYLRGFADALQYSYFYFNK